MGTHHEYYKSYQMYLKLFGLWFVFFLMFIGNTDSTDSPFFMIIFLAPPVFIGLHRFFSYLTTENQIAPAHQAWWKFIMISIMLRQTDTALTWCVGAFSIQKDQRYYYQTDKSAIMITSAILLGLHIVLRFIIHPDTPAFDSPKTKPRVESTCMEKYVPFAIPAMLVLFTDIVILILQIIAFFLKFNINIIIYAKCIALFAQKLVPLALNTRIAISLEEALHNVAYADPLDLSWLGLQTAISPLLAAVHTLLGDSPYVAQWILSVSCTVHILLILRVTKDYPPISNINPPKDQNGIYAALEKTKQNARTLQVSRHRDEQDNKGFDSMIGDITSIQNALREQNESLLKILEEGRANTQGHEQATSIELRDM